MGMLVLDILAMLVLDIMAMLVSDILAMLAILMPLLDMLRTAPLPAPTLLVLHLLLSLPLLVDMPVLAVMLLTLLESSMLPSVRLRLKPIQLSSMELTGMLVLDILAMLVLDITAMLVLDILAMLVILMLLLDMLPTAPQPAPTLLVLPLLLSLLLLVDMPALDVMSLTLPELFMLPKKSKF